MKLTGIAYIPGSRYTMWHAAIFHGCGSRVGASPFADNSERDPLRLTYNRSNVNNIIYPNRALCFPNVLARQLLGTFQVEFIPCIAEYEFDIVVSPNAQWPENCESSATSVELLSDIRRPVGKDHACYDELVPVRLPCHSDQLAREMLSFSFRPALHIPSIIEANASSELFSSVGVVRYEGWFWFHPAAWSAVQTHVDLDFFYVQMADLS